MLAKKRILFVDDEPHVLDGLHRMLHRMQQEWEMEFVTSGQEALDTMAAHPVDVIITDMRMPNMNGAQLLEVVRSRYPDIVRLVLSGYSNRELILRSVGPAHQFLAKPCDANALIATVTRSCTLRSHLNTPALAGVVARIESLPALPATYAELVHTLANDNASSADVGDIISRDLGLTSKILQLVNSAFFGLHEPIDDTSRAVLYLGLDTVKSLALNEGVFSQIDATIVREFSIEKLQEHCLRVGLLSRRIAREASLPSPAQNDAFTGGILHGVGRLIMAANFPQEHRQSLAIARDRGIRLPEAEREILGATHTQLGGYLLGLWGLSDPIVEAVTFHNEPGASPNRTAGPLMVVHVANHLDQKSTASAFSEGPCPLDLQYLAEVGMTEQLSHWRTLAPTLVPVSEESSIGAFNGR